MDEKAKLLQCLQPDQTSFVPHPDKHASSYFKHYSVFQALQRIALGFSIAALAAWSFWPRLNQPPARFPLSQYDLGDLASPTTCESRYEECPAFVDTYTRLFNFDVPSYGNVPQNWTFIDYSRVPVGQNFRGKVRFIRGDMMQASDIMVKFVTQSTRYFWGNFYFSSSKSGFSMEFVFDSHDGVCTEIQILIALRPWPRRYLQDFKIQTQFMDIEVSKDLNWEVNHLITDTTFGNTFLDGKGSTEPFIAHNVSMTSSTGILAGSLVLDGFIELRTNAGKVGLVLIPRLNHSFNPEHISISTLSGNVTVETAVIDFAPYSVSHITDIHTESGDIHAIGLLHGLITNVTSVHGNIAFGLQSLGVTNSEKPSEIHTYSAFGDVDFGFYDGNPEERTSPLLNTTCIHRTDHGRLSIRYTDSWNGTIEGRIEHGPLNIMGSGLEEIERGEGHVKATRGEGGKNSINAWVEHGELDIRIAV